MALKNLAVILLVVLVASQGTARPDTTDIVNRIKDALKKVSEEMESLVKSVQQKFQEIEEAAKEEWNKVKEELQKEEQKLQNEIKEITEVAGRVIPCTKAQQDNISGIFSNGEKQVKVCALKAGIKLLPLMGKVNATLQKIRNLPKQCREDNNVMHCISDVVKEMKEVRTEAGEELQQFLNLTPDVAKIAKDCAQKILQDSTQELRAIYQEIGACIKQTS